MMETLKSRLTLGRSARRILFGVGLLAALAMAKDGDKSGLEGDVFLAEKPKSQRKETIERLLADPKPLQPSGPATPNAAVPFEAGSDESSDKLTEQDAKALWAKFQKGNYNATYATKIDCVIKLISHRKFREAADLLDYLNRCLIAVRARTCALITKRYLEAYSSDWVPDDVKAKDRHGDFFQGRTESKMYSKKTVTSMCKSLLLVLVELEKQVPIEDMKIGSFGRFSMIRNVKVLIRDLKQGAGVTEKTGILGHGPQWTWRHCAAAVTVIRKAYALEVKTLKTIAANRAKVLNSTAIGEEQIAHKKLLEAQAQGEVAYWRHLKAVSDGEVVY